MTNIFLSFDSGIYFSAIFPPTNMVEFDFVFIEFINDIFSSTLFPPKIKWLT
jgi:hypothetical protein